MTMTAAINGVQTALSALRGSGATPIYTNWQNLIALDLDDPANATAIAAFKARLAAVSTQYTFLSVNSYVDLIAALGALTREELTAPMMLDMEVPWLDFILSEDMDVYDGGQARNLISGGRASTVFADSYDGGAASTTFYYSVDGGNATGLGDIYSGGSASTTFTDVLSGGDALAGCQSSWKSSSFVIAEFLRQGLTDPVRMSVYKQVGEKFWRDACSRVRESGSPRVIVYSSTGYASSDGNSIPIAGYKTSATVDAARSYWPGDSTYYKPITQTAQEHGTNGVTASLIRGQQNADAHGLGFYTGIPTGTVADQLIPYWTIDTNISRKVAGSNVTPPFVSADLSYWIKGTAKVGIGQYRRSLSIAVTEDRDLIPYFNGICDVILFLSPALDVGGAYGGAQWRNHQNGIFSDSATRAELLVASMFDYGDADTLLADAPESVWFWDHSRYYWVSTLLTARSSWPSEANKKVQDSIRCGLEKMFFGRSAKAVGETVGSFDDTAQSAWYLANNLGDSFWNASRAWWRVSGGDQTGLGFNPATSLLSPYLDVSQDIMTEDCWDAIAMYASEYLVSGVEHSRSLLNERGR